jgi:D-alanyl-lipoteichoic acid acyltransferase DltB (MBOAT superfamily)
MLFHSVEFLFVFLPVTWIGFLLLVRAGWFRGVLAWLTLASLVFYGWWNPAYLSLIIGSILLNFWLGRGIGSNAPPKVRIGILLLGLLINVGALGYFKYANFFVDNINFAFGSGFNLERVILPLAISFFTFQQVAYLVDVWKGGSPKYAFIDYAFFVAFFPQLIAGPIVHHGEILPQVAKERWKPVRMLNLQIGITIFIIGLFKKMVLADGCAEYATPIFNASATGIIFAPTEAWIGVVAYTLQLYFDFSGYSDMAIGLARCFGIILPLNFDAPYKATNIIDFWRKWHMTLSRFLRDYVYIPLGGSRKGLTIRYSNLLITMLLGGLWHGAGWNFVIWGGLHGIYLVLNHVFNGLRWFQFAAGSVASRLAGVAGWAITMLAVMVSWVFFRSLDLPSAWRMLESLVGVGATPTESLPIALNALLAGPEKFIWLGFVTAIALIAPSTQQYMRRYRPAFDIRPTKSDSRWPAWRPTAWHAIFTGVILFLVFRRYFQLSPSEFLYFNF